MTGPFFVEGAEPGDALLVAIDDIRMTRRHRLDLRRAGPNVVDPSAVQRFPERQQAEW